MKIVQCHQGSAEWLDARVGRITASRVVELLAKYKDTKKAGQDTAERYNYKIDMVVERLTGRSTENFVSPEMVWGRENEEAARYAYEVQTGRSTEKVGFIIHPRYDWSGASPDSLVEDGGLEIKCPKSANHLKWMREGIVPEEHRPQMYLNMICSDRKWWDFESFDPRMPAGLRSFTSRLQYDPAIGEPLEEEMVKFNDEVNAIIAELKKNIVDMPIEMALGRSTDRLSLAPPVEDWAASFDSIIRGEVTP